MYMCLATLHSRPSYISLTYHELAARPDGSDIFWPVEVDDSNGTLQYRYPLGPPPFGIDLTNSSGNSSEDVSEESRSRRAATKYQYALWPSGIVYYVISLSFSGEWSCIDSDNGRFVHVRNFLPAVVQVAFYSFVWRSDGIDYSHIVLDV